MRRSLPVMLGLGIVLLIALLVGSGFLSLPTVGGGGDVLAEAPQHDPAPRTDPDPIDVTHEDDEEDEVEKDRKKASEKDSKKKNDKKRKDRKDGARKEDKAKEKQGPAGTRNPPKVGDRKGSKNKGGVDRPGRNNKNETPKKERPPQNLGPVTVSDLRGDPEGEGQAPPFMDLEGVRLEAVGDLFYVDLTFTGQVPAKMARGQAMVASIEVDRGERKVSAYAEATEDGWRAYTNRSAEAPASMQISGRTIRFTVPRSFFGNEFGFYAHSSWTKSTVTDTDYFFDFAPDDGNGRFPSGGTT